ncbi:MAG: response regulator [Oscillospiraceae bacterium]|nr:response regulator [Oscillospiraceae bacterium]
MPTMILVEDESFERKSLVNCIDWQLVGIQIIGEAINGSQGFSLVEQLHPDIVLTDVKMPVMDGIELSKKIRRYAPETKIIFLSSYDDFEYAKQAIDLNIQAYVMKPVNEMELLRVVKKAANEITEKAIERHMLDKIKENYSTSRSLAHQALINRMLTGMQMNEDDARNLGLDWLCPPFPHGLGLLLSLYNQGLMYSIDENLPELNRECAKICGQSISVCMNPGVLVTLFCASDELRDGTTARLKQILLDFFEERGERQAKISFICHEKNTGTPAQLYAELSGRGAGSYTPPDSPFEKKKNKKQIADEVENIIEAQYQLPLTLESIAKTMHFTPNYLGTVFKSVKKISVNRFLMKTRIEKAEEFLRGSELSINEIAECCGFGSLTYFYTSFKKETGVTPSDFRQNRIGEA